MQNFTALRSQEFMTHGSLKLKILEQMISPDEVCYGRLYTHEVSQQLSAPAGLPVVS